MSLHAFCAWLANTPLSLLIQNVAWIIPSVQTIHILSVAIVASSAAMIDLRLLGVVGRGHPTADFATRFLPWIWWTLIVLLCTGTILIIGEPARSLQNAAFQLKMCLLILAMGTTLLLQRPLSKDPAYWELTPGHVARGRLLAVVSILLWVGIIFAGRWIAYMNVAE